MLTYRRSNDLEVVAYSDSDYAGCMDSRKSMFGYTFVLGRGAISQKSGKQYVIATSIMDAEFVACFEATMHALWLQNFVSGLGIVDNIVRPLKFYYFNSTAIFLSKNDKYTKGAKNVDIKYLSFKEEVLKEKMSIKHIGTEMLITNLLTKGFATQDICWSC